MKRALPFVLLLGFLTGGCERPPRPRSTQSFDEIAARVTSLNAAEIAAALGEPDSRQAVYLHDERWIWWNYTFLSGTDHPPEERGDLVHLEITFRKPTDPAAHDVPARWRVLQPFGIAYRRVGEKAPLGSRTGAAS